MEGLSIFWHSLVRFPAHGQNRAQVLDELAFFPVFFLLSARGGPFGGVLLAFA